MKAAFYTLGCKVNQYETQLMAEALEQAGYEIVDCAQNADVYIVNSCTVTAASNQKTRQSRHMRVKADFLLRSVHAVSFSLLRRVTHRSGRIRRMYC